MVMVGNNHKQTITETSPNKRNLPFLLPTQMNNSEEHAQIPCFSWATITNTSICNIAFPKSSIR